MNLQTILFALFIFIMVWLFASILLIHNLKISLTKLTEFYLSTLLGLGIALFVCSMAISVFRIFQDKNEDPKIEKELRSSEES